VTYVGIPVPRTEDARLISGQGHYLADLAIPGMLEAVVVRSQDAAGELRSLDADEALSLPGVRMVMTAADLPESARAITRSFYVLTPQFVERHAVEVGGSSEPVLAAGRVCRVGEPTALIVATDRYVAEDARRLVLADVDPSPAVVDPEAALSPGSPLVDPAVPGNLHGRFDVVVGDPDRARENAEHRVSARFRIARSVGSPLENRGVAAKWVDDTLTVWSTTQIPHVLRSYLAPMLGLEEERIRVIAPDMGGSFGGGVYPEEVLVPLAAMRLGRPVRWLEERGEDLMNSRHSRDQLIDAELAFDGNGSFRSLSMRILQDCGAVNPFGITLPFNVASHARSVYRIDHFRAEGLCVLTNKTRNTPVRGAGRPEAAFVVDRLVDMAAHRLGMDPADLRLKNLIPADEMPKDMGMMYRDGNQLVYDSGDFPDQVRTALEASGYQTLRDRKPRSDRHRIGVGMSCHVEGTGLGPHEAAEVRVDTSGKIVVRCGSQPHGQSHATVLAQVCADVFGIRPDDVLVRTGDTALLPFGGGTFGSRSGVTASAVVRIASEQTRRKLEELASDVLEIAVNDLVFEGGRVFPRGVPDAGLTFAELARLAAPGPASRRPHDPGLASLNTFVPPSVTFSSGTQVAVVEVDIDTGMVEVLDVVVVDDCGTILNPMVVDGQQHGGVAHGLGNILLEEFRYDDTGQPGSVTFMDYLLPTATDVPSITVIHRSHPTPLNPLGVKGAGEGATASAPAGIANAICDALAEFGVEVTEMPISPARLLDLIDQGRR